MSFYHTGVANAGKQDQIQRFMSSIFRYFPQAQGLSALPKDWFAAFDCLRDMIERSPQTGKKIIFLDELPWMDTPKSKFLAALEFFWNSWVAHRRDILLIVCGSAAAWMVKNLMNNHGGLHNRVTERIRLRPFNLYETEQFLKSMGCVYERYEIIQLYMTFGGIPFYLNKIRPHKSVLQNVNALCFSTDAAFRNEYHNLYASLFKKSQRHIAIVEALSKKKKGLMRNEIIQLSGQKNGGGLSRVLKELEESSFIRKYRSFGKKQKDALYQLVDPFSLFHLQFMRHADIDDENFWLNTYETPTYASWSGYAFEMVCLQHAQQLKKALGIQGVQTSIYAWQSKEAQIDLVIDRRDRVINLCEMKYAVRPFLIDKNYAERLRTKLGSFKAKTDTKKAIFLTFVSTFGLKANKYSGLIQQDLTMDILFEPDS